MNLQSIESESIPSHPAAEPCYILTGVEEVVGGKATHQTVPRDVAALLQMQGDQIAVLAGQVAELQKRLAESDAQRDQVSG